MTETRDRVAQALEAGGPVRITIDRRGGLVVCAFSRATGCLGLRPAEALTLAEALRTFAHEAAAAQEQ